MREGEGEREVWAATAFSAGVGAQEEIAQRLAGFHHPRMLWIVEDMPGVENALVNAIVNTAAGRWNPILGMGNPDYAKDTLGLFAARPWVKAIRISALDHPNVVTKQDIVPGAVTEVSVGRRLADADGNRNDPIYLSRVRGIAPTHSRRALIQLSWCEAAAARYNDPAFRVGPLALGVDPADAPTGDMSAIARGQGACCTEVEAFHAADASELGRIVKREIGNPEAPINPRFVGIDSVGVGASTINELRRLGIRVRAISGGSRAVPHVDVGQRPEPQEDDPELVSVVDAGTYDNTRSQVLWVLREDLRLNRIGLPNNPKLFEELTALEYKDEESGFKISVLPKAGVRSRIGRSPDRADAVAYWNWVRPRPRVRAREKGQSEDVQPDRNRDQGLERLLARHEKRQKAEEAQFRRMFNRRKNRRSA